MNSILTISSGSQLALIQVSTDEESSVTSNGDSPKARRSRQGASMLSPSASSWNERYPTMCIPKSSAKPFFFPQSRRGRAPMSCSRTGFRPKCFESFLSNLTNLIGDLFHCSALNRVLQPHLQNVDDTVFLELFLPSGSRVRSLCCSGRVNSNTDRPVGVICSSFIVHILSA